MESAVVTGEHIFLRWMDGGDTQRIIAWRNNPRVRKNFIYRENFTEAVHENWVRTMVDCGKVKQFVICTLGDSCPVGSVYFRDIDHRLMDAEYGIFIGEDDAVGRGYGSEAARLAVGYAFDIMKMKKLMLKVFEDNAAAVRSYEKAGFYKVSDREVTCSDGEKKNILLMEHDKKSYEKKRR